MFYKWIQFDKNSNLNAFLEIIFAFYVQLKIILLHLRLLITLRIESLLQEWDCAAWLELELGTQRLRLHGAGRIFEQSNITFAQCKRCLRLLSYAAEYLHA